jgi:hypothetical protein
MVIAFLAIAGILIVPGARAQQQQRHPEQAKPETGPQAGPMMSGGMMSGMAMCQQMMTGGTMCPHQELKSLVQQVVTSFEGIQNEKNPAALQNKLAEHGALLKELQSKIQAGCPMMDRMQGQMNQHSTMTQQGEKAMGFSQTQTTHHFFLKKDGGLIEVEANDPQDTHNRDLIRTHLAHITQAFAAGDFSDPLAVHGQVPAGVPVMQRLKGDIRYTFEQTSRGGRVLINTPNPQALEAIHQFLRFQIREHQTDDSLEVN